jgi:hypothetical protein
VLCEVNRLEPHAPFRNLHAPRRRFSRRYAQRLARTQETHAKGRDQRAAQKLEKQPRSAPLPGAGNPQAGAVRQETASDECVKFSVRRMRFSVVYIASRESMFMRQRKIHIDARFGLGAVVGPLVLGDM